MLTKEPTKHIVLIVTVCLAVVALMLVTLTKTGVFSKPGVTPSPSASSTIEPSITPALSPASTAGWETYKNEEYGFEFLYPPHVTIVPGSYRSELFRIDLKDTGISISINKKADLQFSGVACEGAIYDTQLGMWLEYDSCRPKEQKYTLTCTKPWAPNTNYPSFQIGTGDAGSVGSLTYFLTNKSYALELIQGFHEGMKAIISQEEILALYQSLRFTNGVIPVASKCSLPGIEGLVLPAIVSPMVGEAVYVDQPILIRFSQDLPASIGAFITFSEDEEGRMLYYTLTPQEIKEGNLIAISPFTNLIEAKNIGSIKTADMWISIKFYKFIAGKKIDLDSSYTKKLRVSMKNNLPSKMEVSVNPKVAGDYKVVDGRIVLRRPFSNDLIKSTMENVHACRVVMKPLLDVTGNPVTQYFGDNIDSLNTLVIQSWDPHNTPVDAEFSCAKPDGTRLTKTLLFMTD